MLAEDFRALSWGWFCACKNCDGSLKNHPARPFRERKGVQGKAIRLCPSCILIAIFELENE